MPRLLNMPGQQPGLGQPRPLTGGRPLNVGTPLNSQITPPSLGVDSKKDVTNKILSEHSGVGLGAQGLKDMAKPFLQPFVSTAETLTGKPQEFMGVKSSPSPSEALGESASAALWELPVEKVLAPVLKPLGGIVKGMAERLAGTLTGKGTDIIKEIVENPEVAMKGLKGKDVDVLTQMAQEAKSKVSSLYKEMSSGYKKMLASLPSEEKITRNAQMKSQYERGQIGEEGTKLFKQLGGENLPKLNLSGIKSFVSKNLSSAGVIVDRAKNTLDFSSTVLRKSEENILKEVFGVVNKWKDLSPEGIDTLAIKIGNYRKAGEQTPVLNSIISTLKSDVRNYIGSRYPQIAEQVAKYAKQADTVETLEEILGVKSGNKTADLIDITKKIQGLFSGDKPLEKEFLKQHGLGDVVSKEAGRQVAQSPSRQSASIGEMGKNLIQTVISPKAIGQIAAYTGMVPNKIAPFVEMLKKFAPAEREAIFNLFKEFSSPGQNEASSPSQGQSTNEF